MKERSHVVTPGKRSGSRTESRRIAIGEELNEYVEQQRYAEDLRAFQAAWAKILEEFKQSGDVIELSHLLEKNILAWKVLRCHREIGEALFAFCTEQFLTTDDAYPRTSLKDRLFEIRLAFTVTPETKKSTYTKIFQDISQVIPSTAESILFSEKELFTEEEHTRYRNQLEQEALPAFVRRLIPQDEGIWNAEDIKKDFRTRAKNEYSCLECYLDWEVFRPEIEQAIGRAFRSGNKLGVYILGNLLLPSNRLMNDQEYKKFCAQYSADVAHGMFSLVLDKTEPKRGGNDPKQGPLPFEEAWRAVEQETGMSLDWQHPGVRASVHAQMIALATRGDEYRLSILEHESGMSLDKDLHADAAQKHYSTLLTQGRLDELERHVQQTGILFDASGPIVEEAVHHQLHVHFRTTHCIVVDETETFLRLLKKVRPDIVTPENIYSAFWWVAPHIDVNRFIAWAACLKKIGYPLQIQSPTEKAVLIRYIARAEASQDSSLYERLMEFFPGVADSKNPAYLEEMTEIFLSNLGERSHQITVRRLKELGLYTQDVMYRVEARAQKLYATSKNDWSIEQMKSLYVLGVRPREKDLPLVRHRCGEEFSDHFLRIPKALELEAWTAERAPIWRSIGYRPAWEDHTSAIEEWAMQSVYTGKWREVLLFEEQSGHRLQFTSLQANAPILGAFFRKIPFDKHREIITFGLYDRLGSAGQVALSWCYDGKMKELQELVESTGRSSESLFAQGLQERFKRRLVSIDPFESPLKEDQERFCRTFQVDMALFSPDAPEYALAKRGYSIIAIARSLCENVDGAPESNSRYLIEIKDKEGIKAIWQQVFAIRNNRILDNAYLVKAIIRAHATGHVHQDFAGMEFAGDFFQGFWTAVKDGRYDFAEQVLKIISPADAKFLRDNMKSQQMSIQAIYRRASSELNGAHTWIRLSALTGIPPLSSFAGMRQAFAALLLSKGALAIEDEYGAFFDFARQHGFSVSSSECVTVFSSEVEESYQRIYLLLRGELMDIKSQGYKNIVGYGASNLLAYLVREKKKEHPDSEVVQDLQEKAERCAFQKSISQGSNTKIKEAGSILDQREEEIRAWSTREMRSLPPGQAADTYRFIRSAEDWIERIQLCGSPDMNDPIIRSSWQSMLLKAAIHDSLEFAEGFLQTTDPDGTIPRASNERDWQLRYKRFVLEQLGVGDPAHIARIERLFQQKAVDEQVMSWLNGSADQADALLALLGPLNHFVDVSQRPLLEALAQTTVGSLLSLERFSQVLPFLPFLKERIPQQGLRVLLMRFKILRELGDNLADLDKILEYYHEPKELIAGDYGLIPGSYPLREIAEIYQHRLPKDGVERARAIGALFAKDPVYAYIPELLACRAPSRREEFCPYTHEVDPLILDLKMGGTNLGIPHVKKGLTTFFQAFGLRHLPTLALTMIDVMECDDRRPEVAAQRLTESQSVLIEDLRQLLRIEQEQCTPKELVERIQSFQEELRRSILADEPLPVGLEHSSIGMELFNSLVPAAGEYAVRSDRPSLIVNSRGLTDEFPVPTFLKAKTVEVTVRNEGMLIGKAVQDQVDILATQINEKLDEEPLRTFLAPWDAGAGLLRGEASVQNTEWWIARVRGRLERMRAEIDLKKERTTNEKGKMALQKQSEELSTLIMRSITVEDRARKNPPPLLPLNSVFTHALRALQELCTDKDGKVDTLQVATIAKEEVYALFVGLMGREAPDHIDAVLFPGLNPEATPEEVVRATRENWIKYFYEEYLEHFSRVITQTPDENAPQTEGGQDPVVIRQVPADLEALMHRLWRTRGTAELFRGAGYDKDQKVPDHPLVNAGRSINALRRKRNELLQGEVSVEKTRLGIHPCHGIGRVLSGDIADACFHQHRDALARGEYPEITALLLSLPEKEQQLAGSVLCIDTENEAGERVLVVRALNPTDAILQRTLQASSVVRAVTDYFIDAAKESAITDPKKPVVEVRVCIDHRGGHSTNRQSVYEAEQALLKGPWKDAERENGLVNNASTKFNGYQIWVPGQTVCIWRSLTAKEPARPLRTMEV